MENIDIQCWVRNCMWCPSPFSNAEMRLDYRLVRQQNMLVVAVRRGKKLYPIGPVPPSVFNKLRYIHEAGITIDVMMLNSAPERGLVYVNLFVPGAVLRMAHWRIDQLREDHRDMQRRQRDLFEAEINRRAEIKQRRRDRRKAAAGWVFSMTGRGVRAAWAVVVGRDS